MKKISIHFNTYQNKLKGLPAVVILFIILLIILLIPVLICLAIVIGLSWSIIQVILNLILPSKKNNPVTPVITIPVEEVKNKNE